MKSREYLSNISLISTCNSTVQTLPIFASQHFYTVSRIKLFYEWKSLQSCIRNVSIYWLCFHPEGKNKNKRKRKRNDAVSRFSGILVEYYVMIELPPYSLSSFGHFSWQVLHKLHTHFIILCLVLRDCLLVWDLPRPLIM